MQELSVNDVQEKLKTGEINYNQVYNLDIEIPEYLSIKYFLENQHDNIEKNQKLNILFLDIEVYNYNNFEKFEDMRDNATGVISAITFYSSFEKIYHCYCLLLTHVQSKINISEKENIIKAYKDEFIKENYLSSDEDIKLYFFHNEQQLLENFWKHVHHIDPSMLSGFNCLVGNESIWLKNKISQIKNLQKNKETSNYGNINDWKNTGKKEKIDIILNNGFKISCSKDHVFPILKKDKQKHFKLKHFENSNFWHDTTCENIDLNYDNYVCIRKHTNENEDLTLKSLLINNLEYFEECGFDFIVADISIREFMKLNHKNIFTYTGQYQGKSCFINNPKIWKYSNLKKYINKNIIINYLRNCNELYVYLDSKRKFLINTNNTIPNEILYLLGLVYTDGSREKKSCSNYICNTNQLLIDNCKRIMLKYNILSNDRNWITNDNNVTYCKFGRCNQLYLLFPLIYNSLKNKELNREILSTLSYIQFKYFFAGLFDGDGCYHNGSSAITIAITDKNHKKDLINLSDLLLWNGIYCNVQRKSGVIFISNNQYTTIFINSLPLTHSTKQTSNYKNQKYIQKDSYSKNIKFKESQNFVFVRIKSIINTNEYVEMYDINTQDHYYESTCGIITHNSDEFDIPYLYNRAMKLYNNDENYINAMMSKLGFLKKRYYGNKTIVQIPEYPILDIRHLYIPRDEGGLNYGQKQSSYSLDWISEQELKLKKLEYKSKYNTLDKFYDNEPSGYFKYNIIDVILTVKLNEKLQHIELHNMLRRSMYCPLSMSLRGVSALFDSYFSYIIEKNNNILKYGTTIENIFKLTEQDIKECPIPKSSTKKDKWNIKSIPMKEYRKIISRFPGAYVKEGQGKIFDDDNELYADLDATSLYPSMMQQYNISFDTYFGRIIDANSYNVIEHLNTFINGVKIPDIYYSKIFDAIKKYVNRLIPQNKGEYSQYLYFIIINSLNKLIKYKKTVDQLFKPESYNDYMMLKNYLLVFLDLTSEVKNEEDLDPITYQWLINGKLINNDVYIIENEYSPNIQIISINGQDIPNYLKSNNLSLNSSGCLFYTHEKHEGITYKFISERLALRKSYKNKRNTYNEGSDDYKFYDKRQSSCKINVNSAYGLMGMAGFRFSNKHLARSTTISGKLCLKIAQACGEIYLSQVDKHNGEIV